MRIFKKLILPNTTAWDKNYKWYQFYSKFHSYMVIYHKDSIIYQFLSKFLFTPIYNINNGFRNYRNWYKVIWKDRNFGQDYIFELLQYKLELTREYIVSKNRHTCTDEVNKHITIAINLIERVKTDFYSLEYFDFHTEEMVSSPTGNTVFNPISNKEEETFYLDFITQEDRLNLYFDKYKLSVKTVKKDLDKKGIDYSDNKTLAVWVASYNQQKAQTLLFNIINQKIQSWWD